MLEWMLNQVQSEREWQFAIQELQEIRKDYLQLQKIASDSKQKLPEDNLKNNKNNLIEQESILKKEGKKIRLIRKKPKKQEEEKKVLEEKEEEAKTETKKPEIDEKLDKDLWTAFQKRYEGNIVSIKNICSYKSLVFNPEDPNASLKEFYRISIETISNNEKLTFESPYDIIAKGMTKRVLFLLKISNNISFLLKETVFLKPEETGKEKQNSPLKLASSDENILAPIGLGRSVSCQVEEKIDREKLENFRQWIGSYQRWKIWQHKEESEDNDLQSENCSAYKLIYFFLCSKFNVDEIEVCLMKHNNRCAQRISGLYFMMDFYKIVENTVLEKYLLGSFVEFFKFDCLVNMKCAGKELKDLFLEPLLTNLKTLIESFNFKFERLFQLNINKITLEINKLKAGAKIIEFDTTIKEFFKIIYLNLAEICSLISSKIPFFKSSFLGTLVR